MAVFRRGLFGRKPRHLAAERTSYSHYAGNSDF